MARMLLCFLIVTCFFSCSKELTKEQNAQLLKLYGEHNYFKLDKFVSTLEANSNSPELLLCKAKLDHVFNNSEQSNILIEQLLHEYPNYFNDSIIADLHLCMANNADRLQDFNLASTEGLIATGKYKNFINKDVIRELGYDLNIWQILTNAPKMSVSQTENAQLALSRDIAGLLNIPVVSGKDTTKYVFDTGANISCIIKSQALKCGAKIFEKKAKVSAFTGKVIDSELGIMDINLGNICLKNVVFLVLPDSILTFGNGAYVIKGVIGFPIMNALKQFTIKNDTSLLIPLSPDIANEKNLALDDATPVIMVKYQNDTLPFHFDTGADRTMLYTTFFNKYKNDIEGHFSKATDKLGGAGGAIDAEMYTLDSTLIIAGNDSCYVKKLQVLTNIISEDQKYLYGNFGQDYIKQFSEMKINFSAMNISFTGKKK